jgi:Xaa-Pro aminopeptidase
VTSGHTSRRSRLLDRLSRSKAGAAAIAHPPNVRYLSGFSGSNAVLLISARDAILFTDPRYALQAGRECDCDVRVAPGPLWEEVARLVRKRKLARLAVEADRMPHTAWTRLAADLKGVSRLRPLDGAVEELRAVKDAGEIALIRASVNLCAEAYRAAIAKVLPQTTELELAAELDFQMRKLGAEGPAFETIVAAGDHSALPHARPRPVPVGRNRLLLVDVGASFNGYASDMTRVVHLGRPGRQARTLHRAVLEAQLEGIAALKPGARCSDVDAAARRALRRHGLDKYFQHSTGHGLGLEIHERPRLGRKADARIEAGMVVTIEPGAYLPGFGGVRIEDTVLAGESGAEVLTPASKELLVLNA